MAPETDFGGYESPALIDLGSLSSLTEDFDATFHGSVVKLVSLAVASVPVGGGGGGQQPTGGGGGAQPAPTGNGGVLPQTTTGGGGGTNTPSGGGGGGNTAPATDTTSPSGGNGVQGEQTSGGSGGSGGAGDPATAASTGGKLPFTGYAAMLVAGIGAASAGAGLAIRSRLSPSRKAG